MNSAISTFLLLGFFQGIILAIFIFKKKKNHKANIYLSLSIGFLSISLLANFGEINEWHLTFPHLIGIQNIFIFIFIPTLYFYVLLTTQKIKQISKKYYYHFLPLIIFLILKIPFFFQKTEIKLLEVTSSQETFYSILQESILNLYPLVYSIIMIFLISNYSQRIRLVYADIHKVTLNWLRIIIYSLNTAILLSIIVFLLRFFNIVLPPYIIFSTAILIVSLIYIIGYYALQQPNIFNKELWEIENRKMGSKNEVSNVIFTDFQRKLEQYMTKEMPYKNPDLTIKELAKKISIPVYVLSKIINNKLGHNFFSFINKYRIEKVKELLADPVNKKEQIMILAYNSGFNSKSTFNEYFKKDTGISPSKFRKQALNTV